MPAPSALRASSRSGRSSTIVAAVSATSRSNQVRSVTWRGTAAVPRSWATTCMAIFHPCPRSPRRFSLGHDHVVEEHLAELRVAGDLHHRPHVDPRRLHVHDEQRDPLVSRYVRIGAREHAAPARELAPRDPGLLAVEDPAVIRLDGARAQRGEIGSRLRLGEALAPDLVGREDGRDVASLLLVGAEGEQRRAEHVQADDRDELRRSGGGELLVDDDLLGGGPSAAAVLGRPGAPDVARLVEPALPVAQRQRSARRARGAGTRRRGSARRGTRAPRRGAAAPRASSASFTRAGR